jgi:Rrf2 family nitric oxide-sensitive transcriptional repressor
LADIASANGEIVRLAEVARRLHAPVHRLARLAARLAEVGLLEGMPGRGTRLARRAADMRLGEIIRLLEHGGEEGGVEEHATVFNGMLNEAFDAYFHALEAYTLADLVVMLRPSSMSRNLSLKQRPQTVR